MPVPNPVTVDKVVVKVVGVVAAGGVEGLAPPPKHCRLGFTRTVRRVANKTADLARENIFGSN